MSQAKEQTSADWGTDVPCFSGFDFRTSTKEFSLKFDTSLPSLELNNLRNVRWLTHHWQANYPDARRVFVFATGSLRKALFLYWRLIAQEFGVALPEALKFQPPMLATHAPEFDGRQASLAYRQSGAIGLQRYIEATIRNGDGKVNTPLFLGAINGCPIYVMPTDGETASNESAVSEALSKAQAAKSAFQTLTNQSGLGNKVDLSRLVVFAVDTVSQAKVADKKQPPTGKPINTQAGKRLKEVLLELDEGQKAWVERLFMVWYLVWRYLDSEFMSWSVFYKRYSSETDAKAKEKVVGEIIKQLDYSFDDSVELLLQHVNALVVLASETQACEFGLELRLGLRRLKTMISSSIRLILKGELDQAELLIFLESGGGGLFQQLVAKEKVRLTGEIKVVSSRVGDTDSHQELVQKQPLVNSFFMEFSQWVGQAGEKSESELDKDRLLRLLFHIMGLPWAVFELALSKD